VPICIEPWFNLRIWPGSALSCCFVSPVSSFGRFKEGPYAGENVWNSPQFQRQRRQMLARGIDGLCQEGTYCTVRGQKLSPAEQIEIYRTRYGGTLERWEEVLQAVESGSLLAPPPLVVHAIVGDVCNSECPMCSQREQKAKKQIIGDNGIRHLQRVCRDAACVHLSGGDLFAFPEDRLDRIMTIVPSGATAATITNGRGLTLPAYDRYVIDGPISFMGVSLDTTDPEKYQLQRGRPIGPVLDNLGAIYAAYPSHCIKTAYAAVNAWTLPGLPALREYLSTVGIHELGVTDTYGDNLPDGVKLTGDHVLTPEQVTQFNEADVALAETGPVKVTGWEVVRALLAERVPE